MNSKKISVIIPIYNTKNEISKCLNSVITQTYKNIEILCVDDGSTDGTEKIVDEFAKKDKRIKVVHKKNSGESSARNVGLKMSTGQYIAFCDCDDWIDKNMFEVLAKTLEDENVDMAASGWHKEFSTFSRKITNDLPVSQEIFGRDELLKYLYMRDSYRGFAYMWDKLYRREILRDRYGNLLLFDETLQLGGDILYLAEVALNVKGAKYVDEAFYHYVQREKSGCHTKDVKKLRDSLRAYEIVIKRFEEENVSTEIINYVKRFLAYHSSNAAEIAIAQKQEKAKKEFQDIMRKYENEYMSLNIGCPERINRYQILLDK